MKKGIQTANAIFNNFSNLISGVQKFVNERNSPGLSKKTSAPKIEKKIENLKEDEKNTIKITPRKLGFINFLFLFIYYLKI